MVFFFSVPLGAEAGLTVGMSSLAAGMAIGVVGDAGVRANAQQPGMPKRNGCGGFHVRWVGKNGVVQYGGLRDDYDYLVSFLFLISF